MILGFLTVIIMLGTAYAFFREGVLAAFAMTVNILVAGLIAFNFFEPLAEQLTSMLEGSLLQGYEDSFSLVLIFCLTLAFLRWASNALLHTTIEYHPAIQQGGAALFGLLAGYLVAGFLVCVAQTLPASEHFLQFEAKVDSSGDKPKHRILPSDRVWLALMHRASIESLAWDESSVFDPDGSFELRYRSRRHDDSQESHE